MIHFLYKVFSIRRSMRLRRECLKKGDFAGELHYGALGITQGTLYGVLLGIPAFFLGTLVWG